MSDPTRVALVVCPGENPQPFIDAIAHGAGHAVVIASDDELPDDVGGLMVAGEAGARTAAQGVGAVEGRTQGS